MDRRKLTEEIPFICNADEAAARRLRAMISDLDDAALERLHAGLSRLAEAGHEAANPVDARQFLARADAGLAQWHAAIALLEAERYTVLPPPPPPPPTTTALAEG